MKRNTWISGFPRIGENRELKKILEQYWAGAITNANLEDMAREIRKKHWMDQQRIGAGYISVNDFSYYDQMLDTAVMLNAIPKRFRSISDPHSCYFAMARGNKDTAALEMTKWFNTNYHYLVPELDNSIDFKLNAEKIKKEYDEALALGIQPKINIIGPITFTALSKTTHGGDPFDYFEQISALYGDLLVFLDKWYDSPIVQLEEPVFVKNPSSEILSRIKPCYVKLCAQAGNVRVAVTSYFEHACEAVKELVETPVWGIGLDFVHGPGNLNCLDLIKDKKLIAGVVDGRNIWVNDYDKTLTLLNQIAGIFPREQIIFSTSCSLQHVPYTVKNEPQSPILSWLSFALEKVQETLDLSRLFFNEQVSQEDRNVLDQNRKVSEERLSLTNQSVLKMDHSNLDSASVRKGRFEERIVLQKEALKLPSFPTTTIGSFPQTREIRRIRNLYRKGEISLEEYEGQLKVYIDDCIALQEEMGLDVLVHGEPERNDMVEYFGEQLEGFHFTRNGWVQSYGSRCVKPPVLYGDVRRPFPMTVPWIAYAQSRTDRIMKGMLTGPVTIINWSFVRNDIPLSMIARQIALALRDEVKDLQDAGIGIIQVDEAAFKEGYPLRSEKVKAYEKWAVDSFRLSVSSAAMETQIHSHMCYSEFGDILPTLEAMDADVITIETTRSGNRLLKVFYDQGYQNEIGPGVYDIHSPRIPSEEEFKEQIENRLKVLEPSRMWVNPDCGLKTRKWEEVKPALKNMVAAVRKIRSEQAIPV